MKRRSRCTAPRGTTKRCSRVKRSRAPAWRRRHTPRRCPIYEFIAEADPKAVVVPDIYFLLADAYQATGNTPRAIASLEKSLTVKSKNVEAYARLADLYQKKGMTEKAKQTLESIVTLSPNDPSVYLSLGQYNLKEKKYAEALAQFQKSNALKASAEAAGGVAIAAYNLNKTDIALDAAQSAVTLDPSQWEPRVILANILLLNKNYRDAQPHLEYMVKKEPSKIDYKEELATCYDKNGEKGKLLDLDRQIVAASQTNVDSRLRLAADADARKNIDAAYPLYKEIAVLQPRNADVLHRLYVICLEKKELAPRPVISDGTLKSSRPPKTNVITATCSTPSRITTRRSSHTAPPSS